MVAAPACVDELAGACWGEWKVELSEALQVYLAIAIARDEDLACFDGIVAQVDVCDGFVVEEAERRGVGIRGTAQDLWGTTTVWTST